jgi:hypothetical protein
LGHGWASQHPEHDPFDLGQLIAAGDLDVVDGDPPVPIDVWRVTDLDTPHGYDLADGLTPHMAVLLVGCYTHPGDTIVSLGFDPALAGAAGGSARTYLPIDDPADLADVDRVAGTVRLVVLLWPPTHRTGTPATTGSGNAASRDELIDLFRACKVITGRDGCTIVALAATPTDTTATDGYTEHAGLLIPAARHAGLGWLQHILAITAPINGDRITWQATPTDRATLRAANHITIHIDLLVFKTRPSRQSRHD